jgi:hypothetical protein
MTDAKDPAKELVPLAWSWIAAPRLQMEGLTYDYDTFTYDQAQKAYVLKSDGKEEEIEFELDVDDEFAGIGQTLRNPVIVIKDWGTSGVELKVDGKDREVVKNFRIGYAQTHTGTDLVLWLKAESEETMKFTINRK